MIKETIKYELTKRNWSVRKLSDETGIRYPSLTNYLNSDSNLNSKNLEIIFKTLHILQKKEYTAKEAIRYQFGKETQKARLK